MNATPTGGSATPSRETLPRRARRGGDAQDGGPDDGPHSEPGRDPDGRRYADADDATLNRLLSGLRGI